MQPSQGMQMLFSALIMCWLPGQINLDMMGWPYPSSSLTCLQISRESHRRHSTISPESMLALTQ